MPLQSVWCQARGPRIFHRHLQNGEKKKTGITAETAKVMTEAGAPGHGLRARNRGECAVYRGAKKCNRHGSGAGSFDRAIFAGGRQHARC